MLTKTMLMLGAILASSAVFAATALPVDRAAVADLDHALKNRLLAIEGTSDRLVTVGRRGHILVSKDLGQTWLQSPSPVASDLVAAEMVNDQLGFAVGHDGVVLRTQDAGDTWNKVLDGRQAAQIISKYRANNSQLSEDAQFEYERFELEGADKPFLTVHFSDARNGVVLGAFNYGFITADGGDTWQPLSHRIENPSGFHIYSAFSHNGELYAVGEKGLMLHWDRESSRFMAMQSPYEGTWFGGLSVGGGVLLYGLRGSVYYGTPDGQWQAVELGIEDSLNNAVAIDDRTAMLVSQSGRIFKIDLKDGQAQASALEKTGAMPLYDVELAGNALVAVGARGVRHFPLHHNQ
jgi:photosystem II stability/assembly factor-like uncharacterized protein